MAIMTVDAYTDGLVNEPEEKYYESRQPFRVEEIFDLGNELIEGATLNGNAVGNFESESILQGLGAVVIVRSIFVPRSLKLSTHSGPKTQLAPVSRTLPNILVLRELECREWLGGLLRYYYRDAA